MRMTTKQIQGSLELREWRKFINPQKLKEEEELKTRQLEQLTKLNKLYHAKKTPSFSV